MAKKIISLDELAYFKSLLAGVAISGEYGDLEGKPLWIGTQEEYESEVSDIPVGTVIVITDDGGNVITINYADVTNKPQINGVTLQSNKTGAQLGLVDAIAGKGLSSNDYTNAEKTKLSSVSDGAQPNAIETITVNGVAQVINNKTVALTFGTAAAKDSTSAVTANSTDLVESGAVKSAIDAAMVSAYKAGGSKTCAELTNALLVAANEGYVYTMSDTGTTTSDFIEGAGKEIGVGADVGVIKRDGTYKFNLLPGIIDTSNFINKSATNGLVKNDGSIDTQTTGKAASAVQSVKITGDETEYKSGTNVVLPAYPTTLPASDTTDEYSADGEVPVSGKAVSAALGTLDVGEIGGTGKYIQKISETDGKISATAQDLNATAVGLGNVANTGDSDTPVQNGTTKFTTGGAYTELAKKVDKVAGKGLSTEDYTTTEKSKLDGIATGAEVNVVESISVGGIAQSVTNKNTNLQVADYDEIAKMFGWEFVEDIVDPSHINNGHFYLYSNGCVVISRRFEAPIDTSKSNLVKTVIFLNDKPSTLSYGTIRPCKNISKVLFMNSNYRYLANSSFYGMSNLTKIELPDSITEIHGSAFGQNLCLKSVSMPSQLTTIEQEVFMSCASLDNIVIHEGLVSIGKMAFWSCSSLSNIVLPKSLASIGEDAFAYDTSLTDIYYRGTQAQWNAIEGIGSAGIPNTTTIHYEYTD